MCDDVINDRISWNKGGGQKRHETCQKIITSLLVWIKNCRIRTDSSIKKHSTGYSFVDEKLWKSLVLKFYRKLFLIHSLSVTHTKCEGKWATMSEKCGKLHKIYEKMKEYVCGNFPALSYLLLISKFGNIRRECPLAFLYYGNWRNFDLCYMEWLSGTSI